MSSVMVRAAGRPEGSEGKPAELTFEDVYNTHVQSVARWAARLGGPGVDVEDLTQEVFAIVSRRLPEFRHESRLATWLFAITAKVAANDRRRRRLRAWWTRLAPDVVERTAARGESALEQLEKRERRAMFYRALDRLGERHRRVLVLFELEELPVDGIAELMAVRPGNVRVLLHRARAAFLKQMTACELQAEKGSAR
jgi:RNA polymerase sigma-70 factor (ECF subfamily)